MNGHAKNGQENEEEGTRMDCRLIALDLDGTLLNREKQIPPENLAALEKAHRAGIVLVPASGRSRAGIPDCVKAAPYFRYFITSNGASVWDRARGEEIWSAPIAPELALRALAALGEMDGETDVYADGGGLIGAASLKRLAEFPMPARQLAYIRATRRPVASLRDAVAAARSVELMQILLREPAQKQALIARLREQFPGLSVVTSMDNNIELNSARAGKGAALTALCGLLGIPTEQTAAFGDEQNDLPMLRAAGLGIAMGNAQPEVRAAAGLVTGTNEEAGVAQAIFRLLEN
jgi:Cof subfamily protein (haloacid dehalogenase superfamily)